VNSISYTYTRMIYTGEYYLIYIIHSEIKFWLGNMEIFVTNRGKPDLLYDGFQYRTHREAKSSWTWRFTKKNARQHALLISVTYWCYTADSSITILSQMRDRFKDIKFVKSANARPRMNREKDQNKSIMTEIAKQDTTDLLPGDVKSIRQAIYRRRRKTQPKLAKVEKRNARGARSVWGALKSRWQDDIH